MKQTLEQLNQEGKRLRGIIDRLGARRRNAEEMIAEIEAGYPQRLINVAEEGEGFEALDGTLAELARLRGIIAEPVDAAARIIRGRMDLINEKTQKIRRIQEIRDENLEFRKLFNKILLQRQFHVDQEKTLRHLAGISDKPAVDRLCAELSEFKRLGPAMVKFEDIVTIPPFSEEPDDSVIEVE